MARVHKWKYLRYLQYFLFFCSLQNVWQVKYANVILKRLKQETLLPVPENPENVPVLFFYAVAQVPSRATSLSDDCVCQLVNMF